MESTRPGKETQKRLLVQNLRDRGYKVEEGEFPRYNTPIGMMIKDMLHGKLELSQMETAELYEIDRYHAQGTFDKMEADGVDFLILDRYTMSNLFQVAQGLSEIGLLWLQHGLRPADMHIIVDIPVEESVRRGQAFETLDNYEKDTALLEKVRALHLKYVEKGDYYGTGVVKAVDGTKPVDEVAEDIYELVTDHFVHSVPALWGKLK